MARVIHQFLRSVAACRRSLRCTRRPRHVWFNEDRDNHRQHHNRFPGRQLRAPLKPETQPSPDKHTGASRRNIAGRESDALIAADIFSRRGPMMMANQSERPSRPVLWHKGRTPQNQRRPIFVIGKSAANHLSQLGRQIAGVRQKAVNHSPRRRERGQNI